MPPITSEQILVIMLAKDLRILELETINKQLGEEVRKLNEKIAKLERPDEGPAPEQR